ncbi:MAG: cyclic nucleotide-binding domain-containing protein [Methylacidiphilales bacterium]|nr:cyclic nucleotide-binding domain-containing protein [Candidatus Methylacidiphilales bacterium]
MELQPGDFVFHEGEISNVFYVIDHGSVEIIKDADSAAPTLIATLRDDDFFGEMSMLECLKRCASARCATAVKLYALHSTDLHKLYHRWPDQYAIVILNIARDLSRRLHALDDIFAARAH